MNMQERFVLQKTDKNTFRKDSKIGANLRLKKMKSVMKQGAEAETLYGLMELQDYIYPIDGWLQDYEMELGNAGK